MNYDPVHLKMTVTQELGIQREKIENKTYFKEIYNLEMADYKILLFLEKRNKKQIKAFDLENKTTRTIIECDKNIRSFRHRHGDTLLIFNDSSIIFKSKNATLDFKFTHFSKGIMGDFEGNVIYIFDVQSNVISIYHHGSLQKKIGIKGLRVKELSSFRKCGSEFIISDCERHVVHRISMEGETLQTFGVSNDPGRHHKLAYPSDIQIIKDHIVIADSMNHRIIKINKKNEVVWSYGNEVTDAPFYQNKLYWPQSICITERGSLLIADTRNHRIIEINEKKELIQSWGTNQISKRALNFPRSIQYDDKTDMLLVSDTANDRILSIKATTGEIVNLCLKAKNLPPLRWPRWTWKQNEKMIIADSRHSRIITYHLNKHRYDICLLPFSADPHQIHGTPAGVYIVDSMLNKILFQSRTGRLSNAFEHLELNDPHLMDVSKQGWICIADSGNQRILILNQRKRIVKILYEICGTKLTFPRFCQFVNEHLLCVSTGMNGLLFIIELTSFQALYVIKTDEEEVMTAIDKSRSMCMLKGKIYLSDNYFSRILKLEIERDEGK